MPAKILITGVSSGIGHALAEAYLEGGAQVLALGRRPPEGWQGKPGFAFVPVDLSLPADIPGALDRLLAGVNLLDTVILNAGVMGGIADMADSSLENLKRMMDVNLWANHVLLQSLFAGGRRADHVVAISSGAAVTGARGWNGYALSKAALNMLMKLYAAERPDMHFSALAPGLVDTAMQDQVRMLPADPRFPSVERLKRAQGTPDMPFPRAVAPRLLETFQRLRGLPSGEFFDLRTL